MGVDLGFFRLLTLGVHIKRIEDIPDAFRRGMHDVDAHFVDLMASDAKARAPRGDTGALVNGIRGDHDGDGSTFSAHAISPHGSHEDYAAFVEYGHGTGYADDHFFAGNGAGALRKAQKDYHGGRAAGDPFFHPAALGPLAERGEKAQDFLVSLVKTVNFWE